MAKQNHTSDYPAIKSYVFRNGRSTRAQQQALDKQWKTYGIDYTSEELDLAKCFERPQSTVLEIGYGNGESLVTMAQQNPDKNYLGIEVYPPGVGHLIHLSHQAGLTNVKTLRHDAVEVITNSIPDHSLEAVQIFFPDPWHKRKHNKRRLIQIHTLALLHQKLQANGRLHIATDWLDYALHTYEMLQSSEHFASTHDAWSIERPAHRPITKFERRGFRLGHATWDFIYQTINE